MIEIAAFMGGLGLLMLGVSAAAFVFGGATEAKQPRELQSPISRDTYVPPSPRWGE